MSGRHQRARSRLRPARWAIIAVVVLVLGPAAVAIARLTSAASGPAHPRASSAQGTSSAQGAATSPARRVAVAGAGRVLPADSPAARQGAAPCTVVRVLASLENADMVRALSAAYLAQPRDVDGHCVRTEVSSAASGDAERAAAAGFASQPVGSRPTVWLPDSSSWLELARAAQARPVIPATHPSVAETPIVVAMPAPLTRAIGWDRHPPTWATVLHTAGDPSIWRRLGQPGWGAFKLGKATPTLATSGLVALTESYVAADRGQVPTAAAIASAALEAKVAAEELATSHYINTPAHFLFHAREAEMQGSLAPFLSAMIIGESTVWDYNRGRTATDTGAGSMGGGSTGGGSMGDADMTMAVGAPPHEKLVPVYPTDGVLVADDPAAVLDASWSSAAQRAAAADFIRFAATAQGQAVVRANGFRDINGVLDAGVRSTTLAAVRIHPDPLPPAAVLAAVQRSFAAVRKPARVLFLLDVSGSMNDPAGGGATKLVDAKRAIADALRYFGPNDEVGLSAFSNRTGGAIVPGSVSPVAPLRTGRSAFLARLAHLHAISQTPLYAAVTKYARYMAHGYRAGRINAIILLSDGRNDTTLGGTRAAMLATLAAVHRATPVLVFTLAYGHDADRAALAAIAETSGAHTYSATDPMTVDQVLGDDLVTSL